MNNHFTYMWQRQPYKSWKGESTNSIVPVWTKPNINGPVPPGTKYIGPNGPNFKARPIRHWRKQLEPRSGSGKGRAGVGMPMDVPGGKVAIGKNLTVYKEGYEIKQIESFTLPENMLGVYCKTTIEEVPKVVKDYLANVFFKYKSYQFNPLSYKNDKGYFIVSIKQFESPPYIIAHMNYYIISINTLDLVIVAQDTAVADNFVPPKLVDDLTSLYGWSSRRGGTTVTHITQKFLFKNKNTCVSYTECNCENAKRMKDNILRDNPVKNFISVYKQGIKLKQTSDNLIPEVLLDVYCRIDKNSTPLDLYLRGNKGVNNYVFKNKNNYYLYVEFGAGEARYMILRDPPLVSTNYPDTIYSLTGYINTIDINTKISANILNTSTEQPPPALILCSTTDYSDAGTTCIYPDKVIFVDNDTSCLSFTKPTDKDNLLDIRKEYQLDDDDVIKLEKRPSSSPQKFLNRSKFNPQIVDLGNPKVVCTSCNPENNRLRTGSVNFNENYSDNTAAYLASRCKTYDKNLLGIKDPITVDRNPVTKKITWPENSDTGPQNRIASDCHGPVKNSINIISKSNKNPRCNYKIIYKPNNLRFAKQGASTSGSRIQRLRYDTLTNYGSQFNSSQGAQATNDGTFLFDAMAQYFIKTKYQAFIHHRKPGNHSKCFLTPTGSVGGVAPLPPPPFIPDPPPIKQKYSCGYGLLEGKCVLDPLGPYTLEDCQNGACDSTPISEQMGVCDGDGNCVPVDPTNLNLTKLPCNINKVKTYAGRTYCPECWQCSSDSGGNTCSPCKYDECDRVECLPTEPCNIPPLQLSAFKAQNADDNDVELLNNDEEESYDKVLEDDTMYG